MPSGPKKKKRVASVEKSATGKVLKTCVQNQTFGHCSHCARSNASLNFPANPFESKFSVIFSRTGAPSDQSLANHSQHFSLPASSLWSHSPRATFTTLRLQANFSVLSWQRKTHPTCCLVHEQHGILSPLSVHIHFLLRKRNKRTSTNSQMQRTSSSCSSIWSTRTSTKRSMICSTAARRQQRSGRVMLSSSSCNSKSSGSISELVSLCSREAVFVVSGSTSQL